jgi:hypothetical protein
VRFLTAEAAVDQFLDIGTGIPAADNTHEVAQALLPDCRIVYVDNNPVAVLHAKALPADPADVDGELVARYAGMLAPGSVLAVSTIGSGNPNAAANARESYTASKTYTHVREDIAGFLETAGLEVVDGPAARSRWCWPFAVTIYSPGVLGLVPPIMLHHPLGRPVRGRLSHAPPRTSALLTRRELRRLRPSYGG